ncbi:MAG: discoidin domain-containing protein, partial [Colwellia sp.]|nr:discoidin domain-containing protein [Colwellia sp.]
MGIISSSFGLHATDLYLSPTGNDSTGDGSVSAPWSTLQKARNHVRTITTLTEDMNIILKDGVYELDSTLTLNSSDSGRNGYRITYKAAAGKSPVISGGTVISNWSDANSDGIWEASIPASSNSRQLYVNGQRATRARSVNGTGWSRNATGYSTPNGVFSWSNQSDIELVFGYRWKMYRGGVSSVSGNQATLDQPFFTASALGPFGLVDQNAGVIWVENNLALLDTGGEWYLDNSTSASPVNIALSGTATQSSTWGANAASRAIDGNTSGSWSQNEITHTDLGSQPYWTLDLGSVKQIDLIKIWNRTDCCSSRLKGFHVFVSDNAFIGTTVADSQGQTGVLDKAFTGVTGTTTEFSINRTGRYLRIQLLDTTVTGENVLSLAEVEVFSGTAPSSNKLYYKPKAGELLTGSNAVEVVLPRLETLIDADGVANISFEGLQFSYATWLYPNGNNGYLSVQSGVHMKQTDFITIEDAFEGIEQIPGNVRFKFSNNIKFKNNSFKHLGATALELGRGAQSNTVFNNTFDDISGSAIWIGHAQDSHVSLSSYETKDNLIDNNLVKNTGREYDDTSGITSVWASRTVIINNDVSNTPYSGISIGWGWGRYDVDQFAFTTDNTGKAFNTATQLKDTLVINNLVDKPMQVRHDGGGIYNLSSNMNSR